MCESDVQLHASGEANQTIFLRFVDTSMKLVHKHPSVGGKSSFLTNVSNTKSTPKTSYEQEERKRAQRYQGPVVSVFRPL